MLKKRTFTLNDESEEELVRFYETRPFTVDGILYTPPQCVSGFFAGHVPDPHNLDDDPIQYAQHDAMFELKNDTYVTYDT